MKTPFRNPVALNFDNLPALVARRNVAFFYARMTLYDAALSGRLDFVNMVAKYCTEIGYAPQLLEAKDDFTEDLIAEGRDQLHFFLEDKPRQGPGIFHLVPSYLYGFWYLDLKAARNNSSIATARFDPDEIDAGRAVDFANRLRRRFIAGNRSKYAQAPRALTGHDHKPAEGPVTFFCQTQDAAKYHAHWIARDDIIRVLLDQVQDRPVQIKPHPLSPEPERHDLEALAGPYLVEASIHDLIENSAQIIVQSSAVGFEAYLHRRNVLLCGETDFHHIARLCKTPDDLAENLSTAPQPNDIYDKYLYWFCHDNLFEPDDNARCLQRIATRIQSNLPARAEGSGAD